MQISCCKCSQELVPEESWYGLHTGCFKEYFDLADTAHFLDLVARSQSQAF